ncbi:MULTISPECIES: zinc-dependent metalloprotease family protein [Nocardioides]|uniref:Zinc-dependent metalloprotease family protein n=1 Tax=Nocardioides vastitatis TaxID=2568655 RepID=A0ABW0ZIW3_9ACTN|nr:M12 family metallo-peptidase [Nocardioides sp.]
MAFVLAGLAVGAVGLAIPASAEDPTPAPGLTSEAERLAEHAEEDPELHFADDGTVFAADMWHQVPEATDPAGDDGTELAYSETVASYSLAETFRLHSRPGASRTVYLDFNGGSLISTNAWLKEGLRSEVYPGWSTDGSAAFSDGERTAIQEVWARVAEDFAPFDIDVTTEQPAEGALWRSSYSDMVYGTRVAFTSGSTVQNDLCGGGCGGVAWVGTFDWVTQGEVRSPAWVFPSALGDRPKNLAEAAAHEVGHNLGLTHDGTTTSGYYAGGSLWGPIMGSPYSSGVTQWSRGEYTGANNHEDDFAVMAANGAPARPDEAGGSSWTAVSLSTLAGGTGVLSSRTDQDWFTLTGCTGTVAAKATPAAVGPNADLRLQVLDATGTPLASNAPATSRLPGGSVTGLSASLTLSLSGGPYYVAVSGAGSGEDGVAGWSTGGYGSYGSVGTYRLSVTGCGGSEQPVIKDLRPEDPAAEQPDPQPKVYAPSAPPRPRVAPGARGGAKTIRVRWYPPSSTGGARVNGYVLQAYRLNSRGRVVERRATGVRSASARRIEWRLPRGRWVVRVKARNQAGWSALSPRSLRVAPR